MATERLPITKYRRQLIQMHRDLVGWRVSYHTAIGAHPDDWIGSRYVQRVEVLDAALEQTTALLRTLDGLPRLS
jgi:hypothetical protein